LRSACWIAQAFRSHICSPSSPPPSECPHHKLLLGSLPKRNPFPPVGGRDSRGRNVTTRLVAVL
jgi:hypothetical protein